jgi:hypothetical protein
MSGASTPLVKSQQREDALMLSAIALVVIAVLLVLAGVSLKNVLAGVGVTVAGFIASGRWKRWGPVWDHFWRKREISIDESSFVGLPLGRSVHTIVLTPRFGACEVDTLDIRFVNCKTVWRKSPPVSADSIEVVGCQWKRRPKQEDVSFKMELEPYSGGCRITFPEKTPELKKKLGVQLQLSVEAKKQEWSGYISTEWHIPGRDYRSYGRRRAAVGCYRPFQVWGKCIKNQLQRLRTHIPLVEDPPSPNDTRQYPSDVLTVESAAYRWEGHTPPSEGGREVLPSEVEERKDWLHQKIEDGALDVVGEIRKTKSFKQEYTRLVSARSLRDFANREGVNLPEHVGGGAI